MANDNYGDPNKRSSNNVHRLPGFGPSATPEDAGYMAWVRLHANDQQLLAMREDLRRVAEMEHGAQQMMEQHGQLQQQYIKLLQLLAYQLLVRSGSEPAVGDLEPGVIMRDHVTEWDLRAVADKILDVEVDEHASGWWLKLRESSSEATSEGGP